MKKLTLTALSIMLFSAVAHAQEVTPILAPVDPLAWAVANADWGAAGGAQVDSLRKIVNGQVAAHQVNCSYTDTRSQAVMRVKCASPANCIICSKSAAEAGKKLRMEISASSANAQAAGGMMAAMATYAQQRATAMAEQAKWNELRNQNTITETTSGPNGETETVTKTVKVENAADKEMERTSQILKQMAASAHVQSQYPGQMVNTYVNAAIETLEKPSPATVVLSGQDPLNSADTTPETATTPDAQALMPTSAVPATAPAGQMLF